MRAIGYAAPVSRTVTLRLVEAAVWAGLGLMAGCDDGESTAEPAAELRVLEWSRQLDAERRAHARDVALAETKQGQAQDDFQAVARVLVGAATAIVILILLLARERRGRRVVERWLRLILDRLGGSRSPPQ